MNILFVHQNFPGQFKFLAPALRKLGHNIGVITASTNERETGIPTVRYRWDYETKPMGPGTHYAGHAERGARVAQVAAHVQKEQGYTPDIIVGHPGWGETLFLKEVWPNAKLILFGEFYYATRGLDADFDAEFQTSTLNARISTISKLAHLSQAMTQADGSYAPTSWQAGTFPAAMRADMKVVHDGIDTDGLQPNLAAEYTVPNTGVTLRAGDEVLTFINRNLEPQRGFHIFMRALPEVLRNRPNAHVVLIGGDGKGYGGSPADGRSWKQVMLDELGGQIDRSRVHFVGRVSYNDFKSIMQISRVHAYLTYPFVLSWSMLEAMSMGAMVVGSKTAPVQEVIIDGVNGRLVEFFDVAAWGRVLTECLAEPVKFAPMRIMARETIISNYDLKTVCLPKLLDYILSFGPSDS
ncbi:glycosyltransferase [Cochlodiniinecator piscidefendens]|uniref:glycosyltransferase n=1 Tax=Cochlodiniinecator piscidefendens TaxID=2715756 RepID=UPI00140D598A|nr:glycosyltransferase [Cochlodiniinecator piscidefendens]